MPQPPSAAANHAPSDGGAAPIRLLVVDDHPVFLDGLAETLVRQADLEIVARTTRGDDVLALWSRHRPDLTLLDIRMAGMNGLTVLRKLRQAQPSACVLMLTSSEEHADAMAALDAGAAGYVSKRSGYAELVDAIREPHAGGRPLCAAVARILAVREQAGPLTHREIEVMLMVSEGHSYEEIAHGLGITERTVRYHVVTAKEKLGAANTPHAVAICYARGVFGPGRSRG